jgi:gliding motility-associated-like protein
MTVKNLPEVIIHPIDTFVAPGSQVVLYANISGTVSSYEWQPSQNLSNSFSLSVITQPLSMSTNYFFNIVTNDGCAVSKELTIGILGNVVMPNAFTPNGDGHNDVFRIPPNTYINLKDFSIYNRWGSKVFSTADAGKGWDGTVNGSKQDAGVYIYVINGSDKNGKLIYKGSVLLIR